MKKRYERNLNALSIEENARLKKFKVCVAGCGGLGGYIIEHLGRLGVGSITAVDGDVFDESNLNRQLLSDENAIGKSKAERAKIRMKQVNSDVEILDINEYITEKNCEKILRGHDVILDALDNITSRLLIEKEARKLSIPLIHGAIAGWYGQMCVILPGDPLFEKIYPEGVERGIEQESGNLPFTAAVIASIQAAEAVKVLLGKNNFLKSKLLTMDLLNNDYEIFEI